MPEEKANTHIDYDAVLTELYAKRDEMNSAISAILLLKGSGSIVPESSGRKVAANNGTLIPSNAFFGMGIGDAAKKYLEMIQAKRTVTQITKGLEDGGMPTQRPNTVYAALRRRESVTGDIERVGEEWGLKEWFSNVSKKPATKARAKAKKSKKKSARQKAGKSVATMPRTPTAAESKEIKEAKPLDEAPRKSISILDAAHKVLTEENAPLHADVLAERINASHGKHTNGKSLAASLPDDSTLRFTNIGRNTWALEAWPESKREKPKAKAATA